MTMYQCWFINYNKCFILMYKVASLVAQSVKNLPAMWETSVQSLDWEDPLEKEMATHSSILAWRIPWTETGSLESMDQKESDTTEQLSTRCSLVQSIWEFSLVSSQFLCKSKTSKKWSLFKKRQKGDHRGKSFYVNTFNSTFFLTFWTKGLVLSFYTGCHKLHSLHCLCPYLCQPDFRLGLIWTLSRVHEAKSE